MLKWLLKPVDWAKKTHDWLLDGDPRQSPISKRWVSSSRERVQILLIRGFSAVYSLIYVMLFQAYSIVAEFFIGTLADMWRSDRRHARDIFMGIVSLILFVVKAVVRVVVGIGRFLGGLLRQ